ncbi:acidic phospholipase A2-like isoform X3 [Dreissena polymorpha]|uniref:acidic phospholipase A2-like isoform X3 n=1 Tax=Dreissena polymorpha TaxID=45954 RepID=UPI002264A60E|nr:acidic phospholipase A2-like isoform X3 [Dreissena polymorpha]
MDFKYSWNIYWIWLLVCIVGVFSTSRDASRLGRVRRNAFQMCHMINQYTGRSCLNLNPYGCFCGYGQRGSEPVDDADRCCAAHDDCYGEVHTEHHCSFWSGLFVGYNHQCTDTDCVCKDEAKCARKVCDCDLQLAKCLGKSEFNPQYQHYDRSQCV